MLSAHVAADICAQSLVCRATVRYPAAPGPGRGECWAPFCQLRQHRAVATRYDYVYRGIIDVASIRIWLRHAPQDLRDML